MIFGCGPTWEQYQKEQAEWHDFFALLPRTIDIVNGYAKCAWLQTIQRRRTYIDCGYAGGYWSDEYRLKPEERDAAEHNEGNQ